MKIFILLFLVSVSSNAFGASDRFVYVSGKLLSFEKSNITYLTSNGITKNFPRDKIIRMNNKRLGRLVMFQILASDLSSGDGEGKGNQ